MSFYFTDNLISLACNKHEEANITSINMEISFLAEKSRLNRKLQKSNKFEKLI